MYFELFDLLHTYIYGAAELTGEMNLVLTFLSTLGSLFVVLMPFIVVWLIIRQIL